MYHHIPKYALAQRFPTHVPQVAWYWDRENIKYFKTYLKYNIIIYFCYTPYNIQSIL